MKKLLAILAMISVIAIGIGCTKSKPKDESLGKKYAMYAIAVFEGPDLKKWLASLSKAESVDLMAEEKDADGKPKPLPSDVSRVKLSDDKIAFMKTAALAEKPIVFIEDTKCFTRPDAGSSVRATIPKGAIGFIKSEKGQYAAVYVGQVGGVWVTEHWVKGGYKSEDNIIVDAKIYHESLDILGKGPDKVKPKEVEEASKKLKEISEGSGFFAPMAKEKMAEIDGKKAPEAVVNPQDSANKPQM